jgi:hypothetical protein
MHAARVDQRQVARLVEVENVLERRLSDPLAEDRLMTREVVAHEHDDDLVGGRELGGGAGPAIARKSRQQKTSKRSLRRSDDRQEE